MKGEIIPHVGFDEIRFGQTEKQVKLLLGEPDDVSRISNNDNSVSIVLQYYDLGVELNFSDEDDFLLGTITFYSNKYILKGVDFIGLNESGLILRAKRLFPDFELEFKFEDMDSNYISSSNGIFFNLSYEIVDSISISPKLRDDKTPIWPS